MQNVSFLSPFRDTSTHPRLSVAGVKEHSRSTTALLEWFPGVRERKYTEVGRALREYYFDALDVATEVDIDFFDALCNFNFGLTTESVDQFFIRALLAKVHVWVSRPAFVDTQRCRKKYHGFRTGLELRRVKISFERK